MKDREEIIEDIASELRKYEGKKKLKKYSEMMDENYRRAKNLKRLLHCPKCGIADIEIGNPDEIENFYNHQKIALTPEGDLYCCKCGWIMKDGVVKV